jgi:nicotinamide phosphoribosyltransferase
MYLNGTWQDIYKQPKTDSTKSSKRGRLIVKSNGKEIITANLGSPYDKMNNSQNMLRTVFEDGVLIRQQTLGEIRKRAEINQS